jgi:hypothetical protein
MKVDVFISFSLSHLRASPFDILLQRRTPSPDLEFFALENGTGTLGWASQKL